MPEVIRIALFGDTHANCPKRSDEARRVLDWGRDDAKARGTHFYGFAGDFNDGPTTPQDRLWDKAYLGSCADIAPTLILPGNHDQPGSLELYAADREYKYPLIVASYPDVHVIDTEAGKLAVAAIPFPWKAHLLAQVGPVAPEDADRIAEQELAKIFLGLGVKVRTLGLPTVALIHGAWRGSKIAEDQPARPLGVEMPIEDMGQIGAGFYCVGHVHLAQETSFNGVPIWTPSSPFYTDYGEANHFKGYIFAEANTETCAIMPTRIPTPVTPMILFEDRWEFGEDGRWAFSTPYPEAKGADIRYRFHYPKEYEKEAKSAAKGIADELYERGAVNVNLDPIPIPAVTTRSAEIVKAATLQEKAALWWEIHSENVNAAEQAVLQEMIGSLQTEHGFSRRLALDAGIHVNKVRMKGWRCFPDEVSLDLDAIPGEVVAISGPNGVGKSLFSELAILGAIYRELPTHGNIGDHATAKDSFIETVFEYGQTYKVTQSVDGRSGQGTTSLVANGVPVVGTETAKRTDYDKWAIGNLPPYSLVTATSFMPQESKGILGMKKGDRKALILRAKGVERYEVLSEAARKQSGAASKDLGETQAKLSEIGQHDLDHLREVCADWRSAMETETGNLAAAERELLRVRGEAGVRAGEIAAYQQLVRDRDALEAQRVSLEAKKRDLEERIKNNSGLLDKAEDIRSAVVSLAEIEANLNDLGKEDSAQRVLEAELTGELRDVRARFNGNAQHGVELTKRRNEAAIIIEGKAGVVESANAIVNRTRDIETVTAEIGRYKTEVEHLQSLVTSASSTENQALRSGHVEIISGVDPIPRAQRAIEDADNILEEAAETPARLDGAKERLAQSEEALKQYQHSLAGHQANAARLPQIEAAEKVWAEALVELETVNALHQSLTQESNQIIAKQEALAIEMSETQKKMESLERAALSLKPLAARTAPLAEAETKIAGYREQLGNLVDGELDPVWDKLGNLNDRLSEMVEPQPLDVSDFEADVKVVQRALEQQRTGLILAERELSDAQTKETRRQELAIRIGELEKAVDRWNLVERTLGKNGLQADEVAAAGDEINDLTNELLRASGDNTFTVDLKTTRMTKDGKREVEDCPINVYNSETGQWQEGSTLSPGQRAFVNLPLSLALAMIGCKESRVRPTLFQDEPSAGLDPENRPKYLTMMRYAVEKVNASKIFFITHNQELMELADSVISINQGKVTMNAEIK